MENYYVKCPYCERESLLQLEGPPLGRMRIICRHCMLMSVHSRLEHESERTGKPKPWVPPPLTEHEKKRVRKGRKWQEREERGEYERKRARYPGYHCNGTLPGFLRNAIQKYTWLPWD